MPIGDTMSDEEFDAMFSEVTPEQEAALGIPPSQMSDESFNAMFPDEGKPAAEYDSAGGWIDYYSNKLKSGTADVTRGRLGAMALTGKVDYESIKNDASMEAIDAKIKSFEGQNFSRWTTDVYGHEFDWDVRRWVGMAAESLPFMGEVFKGGALGAAIGGAGGAGTALIAGQLGPQAALPEELVSVPALAARGAKWGWQGGAFKASAELMSGMTYVDLLDKGISPDVAKPFAYGAGAVSGAIEVLQLGQLTSVGRKALVSQLADEAGQATLKSFIGEYFKEVGVQVLEEELQEVTALTAQALAAAVDNNPDAAPDAQEVIDRLIETLVTAGPASLVLVGGAKAAGAAPGATLKGVAKAAKATEQSRAVERGGEIVSGVAEKVASGQATITQALNMIKQGFEKKPATVEQVDAARKADVGDTLDALLKPVFNEDGSVQASATFTEQPTEPTVDGPLTGAALEIEGRINAVRAELSTVDTEVSALEDELASKEEANILVDTLKGEISALTDARAQVNADIREARAELSRAKKAGDDTAALQAEFNAAVEERDDLTSQIDAARDELSGQKTQAVTALTAKLEKAYTARENINNELVALQSGQYDTLDLANEAITVKGKQVTTLKAKAVNESLKMFRRGLREGVKFAKDEVRAVQRSVVELIKESGLDLKDQAKFIQKLRAVQTVDQLRKALPDIQQRIDRLLEADALREANKKLKRVLKRTELRKGGKRAEGKYTADVQKILDSYRKMVTDEDARAEALARNVAQLGASLEDGQALSAAQTEQTQKQLLDSLVAARVKDLASKTAKEVDALAEEIQAIVDTGKARAIEKKQAEIEARREKVAQAVTSINGAAPVDSASPANSALRVNTLKRSAERFARTVGRTIKSWPGLMKLLSQHDQNSALEDIADTHEAVRVEEANKAEQREKALDVILERAGVNKKTVLNRIIAGAKVEKAGSYVDADGKHQTLYISRNEAIKLWMQTQDADLIAGLKEGNKYTFPEDLAATQKSTYELLSEYLSAEDKAVAQGVLDYYAGYFSRLNEAWEDETGASLTKSDTYSGYARRINLDSGDGVTETQSAAQGFFQEQASRASIRPSSTIARVTNAKGLATADFFVDLMSHINDVEHWLAWRNTAKDLRAIFSNTEVRNTIRLKYGDGMMRTVDMQYHTMVGTRLQQQSEALKFLDTIRRAAGTSFVGGKGLSFFKQMTAITNFLLFVDGKEFVSGVADFLSNPKKAIDILETSPLLKARFETFNRDLMEAIQSDYAKKMGSKRNMLLEINMMAVKYGDRATLWMGGWAVYKAELAKTGDHEKAIRKFEKAFNSTQSSGTADQLSQLEQTGPFGKMMTIFLKQPLQMIDFQMEAIRKAGALPTKENYLAAARTIAVTNAAQMLFQVAASAPGLLFGDGDKVDEELLKILRAAILGPWTGLPVLGDVLGYLAVSATNLVFDADEYAFKPNTIPTDVMQRAVQLPGQLSEILLEDASAENVFDFIHNWNRSLDLVAPLPTRGIPKEPYVNALEKLFVDDDDDKEIGAGIKFNE